MLKTKKIIGRGRFFVFSSIQSRLIVSFTLLGLLFLLAMLIALQAVNDLKIHNRELIRLYKPTELHTHRLIQGLQSCRERLQVSVYSAVALKRRDGKITALQIQEIWDSRVRPNLKNLRRLYEKYENEELLEVLRELTLRLARFQKALQNAYAALQVQNTTIYDAVIPNPSDSPTPKIYYNAMLARILANEISTIQSEITDLSDEMLDKSQIIETGKNIRIISYLNWLLTAEFLLLILVILCIILLIRSLLRFIVRDIKAVRHYFNELLKGDIPDRVKYHAKEFQPLANSFNLLSRNLSEIEQFASQVGDSRFNNEHEMFGDKGNLGGALAGMRDGLKKVSEENEIRYWMNNGIAQFSEIITRNADNLSKLAEEFISNLVIYLGTNQGGFFTIEEENTTKYLELKAAYAYNKKRFIEKRLDLSEGLLGQACTEGEVIYLKEIPPGYVAITSGLGEAVPKTLLIVPLKSDKKVHGVIELGSFDEIINYKREFVFKIAGIVGESIAKTRINEQTRKLLAESQELTQILQNQDEKLRQNVQEMQQTQALMNQTQKELAEKEANLEALINNTTHGIIAFDKHYTITVVNRAMRAMYLDVGINLEIGKNFLQVIPKEDYERHKGEYERVLAGEKFVVLRESERFEKKSFFELHYNAIKDENNTVIGASIFMENITQRRQAEMNVKQTEANLTSLINDTEDSIMAIDTQYRLIIANEVYQKEYTQKGMELKEGTSIFDYLSETEKAEWKAYYDHALSGERFLKVIDSGKFPNKTYREYWFNPIRDENEQITGLSIFSRDVTEAKRSETKIRQLLLESLEATEDLKSQELEMKQKIAEYEMRIKELETPTMDNEQ